MALFCIIFKIFDFEKSTAT